jgi:hypothetical protein
MENEDVLNIKKYPFLSDLSCCFEERIREKVNQYGEKINLLLSAVKFICSTLPSLLFLPQKTFSNHIGINFLMN